MSLIMSIDVETTGIDLTGEDKSKVISLGAVVMPMDTRQPPYELEVFLDVFGETQS
jgi:DNA polymerase III epsilon subunit-like protein